MDLRQLRHFVAVAEEEHFSRAARRANIVQSALSTSIRTLEEELGTQLFARTTRQVRLTDDGRAYYQQCRQALNQLAEAERELSGQQQRPAGTLRISLPTPLGHYRILPLLPEFRRRHPEVALDVQLSDRNVDLLAEGYDLAVRGRAQPDSSLVARKLCDTELVVVATPDYLARHGTPRTPADLAAHDCLQFLLPRNGQPVPWLFRQDGRELELPTSGAIHTREHLLCAVTLARHGAGVLQTYRFIVEDDLASGRLVELLQPYGGRSRPFSLLYPGARHMPLRLRVFIDYLLRAFGQAV